MSEGELADVDSEAELAGVVASGGRCVFVAGAVVAAPFHKHTIKMGAFVAGELTRISDFTSHPSLITVSVVMLTAEFMSLGFDLKFLMTGLMKAQSARAKASPNPNTCSASIIQRGAQRQNASRDDPFAKRTNLPRR